MDDKPDALTAGNALGPKGARTRTAIIDAALQLFRERGYEATTMRAIAAEADVSLGNAYYYFKSKEHLIQAFYDRTQLEHAEAAAPLLAARGRPRGPHRRCRRGLGRRDGALPGLCRDVLQERG